MWAKLGNIFLASLPVNRTYITEVILIQHVISFEDLTENLICVFLLKKQNTYCSFVFIDYFSCPFYCPYL